MLSRKIFLSSGILVTLIALSYFTGFIYNFSKQNTIDPNNLNDQFDNTQTSAIFNNEVFSAPDELAYANPNPQVLGEESYTSDNDEKRIEVDLTNQRLYAYQGDRKVMDFLVSTGKWGKTPTGEFKIWTKLRYTRMTGGSKELHTYYDLPNVPFTMFFANAEIPQSRGFGIHGTYWHNNFGHPMSHGCINMKNEEVEQLYYWANPELGDNQSIKATKDNPGTKVIIYGKAPNT